MTTETREAERDTLVIANGFSCKTQIQQSDARRNALHVAQVMKMAREHGPDGYRAGAPEKPYYEARPSAPPRRRAIRTGAPLAAAALAAAIGFVSARR